MKTLRFYILALISSLTLISCNDDDEFYNAVYIDSPGLATIEVPAGGYAVNDNFDFSIAFSRFVTEPGQTTPLDVYKTSEASSFGFNYYLEKKTGTDTWTTVFANEDEYRVGEVVYFPGTQTYEFDESYLLTSAGEYRFRLGSNAYDLKKTDLISRNPSNKTMVIITTSANNTNSEGYYHFTVN